jgi:GNAT superfamily N-acetyltransferase
VTVRPAVPEDARGIAEVQVQTWRVAYACIVDEDAVIGFCTLVTPARDTELGVGVAEVAPIYVLPSHWRHGIGTALMDAATTSLRDDGYAAAVLWVLEANAPARAFYVARGFAPDGAERDEPRLRLPELRYRVELASG